MNSKCELIAGELRAKLLIDSHNWATCSKPVRTTEPDHGAARDTSGAPSPSSAEKPELRNLLHRGHAHEETLLGHAEADASHGARPLPLDAGDGARTQGRVLDTCLLYTSDAADD